MNILEELFDGEIHPSEKKFTPESEYGKSVRNISETSEALFKILNNEDGEILTRLLKAMEEGSYIAEKEQFMDGFRLGARFILDLFVLPRQSLFDENETN